MPRTGLSYPADFSRDACLRHLNDIITPAVSEASLAREVDRLAILYKIYLRLYPFGLWDSGLEVTTAMRRETELLLPLRVISRPLRHFCRLALRRQVPEDLPLLDGASSWLDVVPLLPPPLQILNPSRLLNLVSRDFALRTKFLFSLRIPSRHGGAFRRYPEQRHVLEQWLRDRCPRNATIRCLDAACGSGEGTYDLADILMSAGLPAGAFSVTGLSLDLLEVFSAAHAFFPHDQLKEDRFRQVAEAVMKRGAAIDFSTGDITEAGSINGTYHVIICNGLLGGPALNDRERLERSAAWLAARLNAGGIILIADRFHGGWKRKVPKRLLAELLMMHGLGVNESGDGLAGYKKGRQP